MAKLKGTPDSSLTLIRAITVERILNLEGSLQLEAFNLKPESPEATYEPVAYIPGYRYEQCQIQNPHKWLP